MCETYALQHQDNLVIYLTHDRSNTKKNEGLNVNADPSILQALTLVA